jgi:hypothetical protein
MANVKGLRNETVRQNFLQVLRAAEISSGHLFTYRDLWTVYSIAIIGRRRREFSRQHPCDWVRTTVDRLEDPEACSAAIRALSEQRYANALFVGNPGAADTDLSGRVPFDAALRSIDPATDAGPQRFAAVHEALQASAYGERPLQLLAEQVPLFGQVVSNLERLVESEAINPALGNTESEASHARQMARYGRMLTRLYALTLGEPANLEVIQHWVTLRLSVGSSSSEMPPSSPIRTGLTMLLLPPSGVVGGSEYCLLPFFEPRTNPVRAGLEKIKWCCRVPLTDANAVTWRVRSRGDSIIVELSRRGAVVAEFPLDFALCREALACTMVVRGQAKPTYGFTESASATSPRMERARASLIAQNKDGQQNLAAVNSSVHEAVLQYSES